MRVLGAVVTVVLLLAVSGYAFGGSARTDEQATADVQRSFSQLLDLWRDGKYAELYDQTHGGNLTREAFTRKLSSAPLRPACCWEKLQEVSVKLEGEGRAVVKAKLGFEGSGGTEFKTGKWKLTREDGAWSMARTDLFSLAGAGKRKKTSYRASRPAAH